VISTKPLDVRDCESIVRRLWPYLDGALPDSDRAIVAEHLANCHDCTSHFDFARAFLDAVHATRREVANEPALERRVLAALSAEGFRIR
jgi:anti-sigma factor (TIGR02949 family)